ncbi:MULTISPECIES: phosphopantetheine-binding protein [Actinosynnema]|uniref:phosphopantetheine-binding protein n=1 Tax=Actinosynnema TaxID=40566 RepID=UPI0020A52CA0|nr:phosphopantetheine-binding protein [Actinosynnema pretiosum]MCP2094317.1 Phosphopantetheine attachment site [Actinosynnema pretiosum]
MWNDDFENLLRGFLPFLPDGEELAPEAELKELGLDSLNAVHLLSVLENTYRVRFDDSALSMETFRTAGALWSTVERTLDHAAR